MKCPYCSDDETEVIDSRESRGNSIRRRRECASCGKRFTTYEKMESHVMVVKKDGTRELFNPEKLEKGIEKACEKRPVTVDTINEIIRRIELRAMDKKAGEIRSKEIGRMVVKELLKIDPVAYIRFTSVYNKFDSPKEFMEAASAANRQRHAKNAKGA
jgi:transcriptional repressor NrdR